jgi:hypothetical protein
VLLVSPQVTTHWCCRSQPNMDEYKQPVKTKLNITRNFWYDEAQGALQHA